jgi:alcohol dehydrogenase
MDAAKGANFILTNGGKMADYWGVGKATKPMLPMIAVPTTAGTGSDAQSFALISDEHTHVKMACGDKKAAFKVALLDPALTVTQPARVTAVCGIDAIAHALESYVARNRNCISLMFAKEAWRLLKDGFEAVLQDPADLEARGAMLLGAHLAGAAIENSMLGAAHSAANPLTATFSVTHGVAVGVMLPHVIRFNNAACAMEYAEAANGDFEASSAGEALADHVAYLLQRASLPSSLQECGVDRSAIGRLAKDAAKQWTANFNPRPVGEQEFIQLYEAAFQNE